MNIQHAFQGLTGLLFVLGAAVAGAGETLYNGVVLPDIWPPVIKAPLTNQPMPVPYLIDRPKAAPINVGRQLFVDDFLIESTDLKRTFHQPKYHPSSPVLRPEAAWEKEKSASRAGAFSDGVWYDPQQKKYLMWYMAAERRTCLAVSDDGVHWNRPTAELEPPTNTVLRTVRDSATVWLDAYATDPRERFKLFEARYKKRPWKMAMHVSSDGRQWSEEVAVSGPSWDRSTMFYNPFRKVWVASVRGHDHAQGERVHRLRCYHEGATPAEALAWKQSSDEVAKGRVLPNDLQPWVGADRLDPHHPDPRFRHIDPQLYNLDVFPYESLMVGLFTIWQGPDNEDCKELNIHKRNEVLVGFTRDGFHWDRTNRQRFLGVSENAKAWNAGNVQSVGGGCIVQDDELWFYCSGRTMHPTSTMATGLAILRRDGFASLDANENGGVLTTRPIIFQGKHLFVNASPGAGELTVAVLDENGKPLPGFGATDCRPITGDHTKVAVTWNESQLASLSGRAVRLRFYLQSGSLWSFWVSSKATGESNGHVAAVGPAYGGPRDQSP